LFLLLFNFFMQGIIFHDLALLTLLSLDIRHAHKFLILYQGS